MLAKELKKLVNQGTVKVRIVAPPFLIDGENPGDSTMADHGKSVAGFSTYLTTGMLADIVDACHMPVISGDMPDASAYLQAITSGFIYFVFKHDDYLEHNEPLAHCNWTNGKEQGHGRVIGTAFQVGAYTGFDMIGFDPDAEMDPLLAPVSGEWALGT